MRKAVDTGEAVGYSGMPRGKVSSAVRVALAHDPETFSENMQFAVILSYP